MLGPDDDSPDANGQPTVTTAGWGGLLSGGRLLTALQTSDRIFRDGSWRPEQIKGAGYELRLAGDMLVMPKEPGAAEYKRVDRGAYKIEELNLAPGDSALISTHEKFSMDFDISCLIGPKFRWSAKGLLVLQGMVAHPGYGRTRNGGGEWVPKEDERLYLVIANIGPSPIHMRRGDPVAYVQFFEVEEPVERKSIDNFGFDYLTDVLFRQDAVDSAGGLAYFKNVRDLGRLIEQERVMRVKTSEELGQLVAGERARLDATVKDLERLVATHRDERDAKLQAMAAQVNSALSAVDRVRSATDNVVVFGVFLVAATILGVVVTALSALIQKLPDELNLTKTVLIVGIATVYAALVVTGVVVVALAAWRAAKQRTK